MRYLGADPTRPACQVERLIMTLLNHYIVAEDKASNGG